MKLEQAIDPGLAKALVPPFSLQPLVENAVQHGLQSSPKAGCLRLVVRHRTGEWLDMSISDDGHGVPSTEVERVFFAVRPRVHALCLLRRRLQGLLGRSFRLEVCSEVGQGTTVTLRIPLRTRFEIAGVLVQILLSVFICREAFQILSGQDRGPNFRSGSWFSG